MSHGRQPEVECFLFWRGFALFHGQENSCFYVCGLTLQTRWRRNAPKSEKYNFRLTSVAQKRLCLSSLLSLDTAVVINSAHICRACLSLLKKRRALLTNIQEVNAKIRNIITSNSFPLPVKVSSTSCSSLWESSDFQEQAAKRVALEADFLAFDQQEEAASRISVEQSLKLVASTPCKEKGHDVVFPVLPVSPIAARLDLEDETEKKTRVQVTVEWPSRTKVNTLHEGLESLGKMLCRGTYKQIAAAVWRNPILRKHVQQLYLQEVDRECTALCSLKNPSCFRSPKKEDLQSFSLKKFNSELESKAPLFSAVLWTASARKSKREDAFWQPSVCMSAAVLLKNRSPCMNTMQLLNTIIL